MDDQRPTALERLYRSPAGSPSATAGPGGDWRQRVPALLLLVIVVALVGSFLAVAGDRLWPGLPVQAVQALALPASGHRAVAEDQVAFQAAGWIEADPWLVHATALVSGVVEEVLVLEDQEVTAGQPLARLDLGDLHLARRRAEAAQGAAAAAVLQAQADVAQAQAQRGQWQARLAVAEARVAEIAEVLQRQEAGGTAVSAGAAAQTRRQMDSAQAAVAAVVAEEQVIAAGVAAAEARLAMAQARSDEAAVAVDQARLNERRGLITAPISGRIQRLRAYPGRPLMLGGDMPFSATVAEIFDPQRLQVRVDVALVDAAGLHVGQRARIAVDALGERRLGGTVTRLAGQADVARNTVQAKVALDEGDELLRPEMLARVQFLGRAETGAEADQGEILQVYLPQSAVDGDSVWLIVEGRLRRHPLRIRARDGAWVAVEGLSPGALVVDRPAPDLSDKQRVQVTLRRWNEVQP